MNAASVNDHEDEDTCDDEVDPRIKVGAIYLIYGISLYQKNYMVCQKNYMVCHTATIV